MTRGRLARRVAAVVLAAVAGASVAQAAEPIQFEQETLPNGLRVIYAPLPESPVVHVRVLYHVGSRDERPDRQGFAHAFEHMMFRGSAHVKPEEHMKTIGMVGGYSNAFTSFDQTVYINTVPAAYADTALYLEADRMASFKVSPQIFWTERLVVAEEWRLRQNQPYGTVWEELLGRVFTKHPYRWTPIGNMDHLRAAQAGELQEFFNKYYVPNNAVLVVAGKVDVPKTKELVKKYYAWIPGQTAAVPGPRGVVHTEAGDTSIPVPAAMPVQRDIPAEPEQAEPRRAEIGMRVPLARVMVAYPMPPLSSPDQDALGLLSSILGDGRSSRLSRLLVTGDKPLCTQVSSLAMALEDGGVIGASATVLDGKTPGAVEEVLRKALADIRDNGVTEAELAKAKQQARIALAGRRETAEEVASELGNEALFYNDPGRVNTEEERVNKITAADIQAVAKKYFVDAKATTLIIKPDPAARLGPPPSAAPATTSAPAANAKAVTFPADYPPAVPLPDAATKATFAKGTEKEINNVTTIVMPDRRMPLVNFSLTMRRGSHTEPAGKEGLGSLTAAMVRRGYTGVSYDAFNEDLDSKGITLEVSDGGDTTRISGTCLSEQLPHAVDLANKLLTQPAFDPAEFAKLKAQTLSSLRLQLNSPTAVAGQELARVLYGDTFLGRSVTPESVASITLDDVREYFKNTYVSTRGDIQAGSFILQNRDGAPAVLIFSGDVSVEDGQKLAGTLTTGMRPGLALAMAATLPTRDARSVLLIDRPESKQANIRMGLRAYSIRSDEKFAGSLASQILSAGIDSRLGRYVRAEKGYVYGIQGIFSPTRQDGTFSVSTDTKPETTAATIEATFEVLAKMASENVTDKELTDAKLRVAGQMAMQTQTISAQANRRVEAILNGYPIDYYDVYPERVAKVTADEIRGVLAKYADPAKMAIVVVAPAAAVQKQLERIGPVTVEPMPLARDKAATKAGATDPATPSTTQPAGK